MSKRDLPILFILALTVLLFFWKALILKGYIFQGDIACVFNPLIAYAKNLIQKGQFPLWVPEMELGYPFFSSTQTNACYYPLNLIYMFFNYFAVNNFIVIIHFFIILISTYYYGRLINLSRNASLLSSVIFAFGGFNITCVTVIFHLESSAWLPPIIYFIERGLQKNSISCFVFAGIVFAIQFLAGTQLWFYTLAMIFLYIILRYIFFENTRSKETLKKYILPFFLILSISILISAVQFLPQFELSKNCGRYSEEQVTFKSVSDYQLCPEEIISFILPKFFGFKTNNGYIGRSMPLAEFSYFGIYPLFLILITMLFIRSNKYARIYMVIALISVLLALGKYSPLYYFQYHLPGFKFFRLPLRYLCLFDFSIAIISGIGFDYLTDPGLKLIDKIRLYKTNIMLMASFIIVSISILMIGCFANEYVIGFWKHFIGYFAKNNDLLYLRSFERVSKMLIRAKDISIFLPVIIFSIISLSMFYLKKKYKLSLPLIKLLIVFAVILDLYLCFGDYNHLISKTYFNTIPESAGFLQKDKSLYRVLNMQMKEYADYASPWRFDDTDMILRSRETLSADTGLFYKINFLIRGTTVPIKNYVTLFYKIINVDLENIKYKTKLLGLLNVKYIFSGTKIDSPYLRLVYSGRLNIYENSNNLGRSFLASSYMIANNKKEMIDIVNNENYDFKNCVILNEKPGDYSSHPGTSAEQKPVICDYSSNRVKICVDIPQDSLLVLSDLYYPGWKAIINGERSKIYKANYAMRAIALSAGKNNIYFYFEPMYFKLGLFLSIFSLFFLAYFLWLKFITFMERNNICS